jgi:hypothetical protein
MSRLPYQLNFTLIIVIRAICSVHLLLTRPSKQRLFSAFGLIIESLKIFFGAVGVIVLVYLSSVLKTIEHY